MGSSDYSGEDDKNDVMNAHHPDRHGADPTEGWRRGTRGALRKSCDACTSSKTKCCGDIPCDRCKKRNIECKFSKRRRCGPKARPPEEKRPRTDEGFSNTAGACGEHCPQDVMMGTVAGGRDGDGSANSGISNNNNLRLDGPLPLVPVTHRSVGFNAPMTADGLSGLVGELMGPSLSDGGGSGSSGVSGVSGSTGGVGEGDTCKNSTFQQANPGRPAARFAQPPAAIANRQISFLSGEASPPRQRNGIDNGNGTVAGTGAGTSAATGAVDTPNPVSALNQPTPSSPGSGINRQPSLRSTRRLTPSHSAPIPITLPPRGLPARSKSVLLTSGQLAGGDELGRADRWEHIGTKTGTATSYPPLPSRGTLPLSLGERPRAHLRTFMRSVGSVVLLPGTEALREATNVEGIECVESPVTASVDAAMSMSGPLSGGGRRAFDPMQVAETNGTLEKSERERSPVRMGGGDARQELDVDMLTEACRAEAWAAVAVGALFSGAGIEEAKMYVSKALGSLARCLDASMPEVASVMILLTLFWMHSMDNRKVLRYFGFAQQVGLELGPLMPENLRHTMAFMSVMITMSLELDHQDTSLAVQVRDPATWSGAQHSRPGGDPFAAALETVTMVCNRIFRENASARRGDQGAVNGVSKPPAQAQPPSKALTDMLRAAADVLNTSAVQEGEQAPDHMLALVYGLIGYTHAARNEMDQATASAKLILEVIDQHPAVLHLPLTYTLAEASSRLVGVRGTSFPANHVESLRAARASLVFARPSPARGDGNATSTRGGWCAFGDHIIATFEKGVVPDGRNTKGNGSSKVRSSENSFQRSVPPSSSSTCRSASMSPPQERSARSTFRSSVPGQGPHWQPISGGSEGNRPARSDQESSSPRWHESTDWVDRVRNMPILADSPNPGITRRTLLRAGHAQSYTDDQASLLTPGPMPAGSPTRPGRFASEPPGGLALLSVVSGVATPGMYSSPRRGQIDVRLGDKEPSSRRGTDGRDPSNSVGMSGNGSSSVGGGGGDDSDDLPPAPPMMNTISFDPNREDPNFPLL